MGRPGLQRRNSGSILAVLWAQYPSGSSKLVTCCHYGAEGLCESDTHTQDTKELSPGIRRFCPYFGLHLIKGLHSQEV